MTERKRVGGRQKGTPNKRTLVRAALIKDNPITFGAKDAALRFKEKGYDPLVALIKNSEVIEKLIERLASDPTTKNYDIIAAINAKSRIDDSLSKYRYPALSAQKVDVDVKQTTGIKVEMITSNRYPKKEEKVIDVPRNGNGNGTIKREEV